jgi:hypothetical protein
MSAAFIAFQNGARIIDTMLCDYHMILCENIKNTQTTEREKKEFETWCSNCCTHGRKALSYLNDIIDQWKSDSYRERMAINACKLQVSNILHCFLKLEMLVKEHKRMTSSRSCEESKYCCMNELDTNKSHLMNLLKL